jgi:hypothetical protein
MKLDANLKMWAVSLLAYRETDDGYEFGHNAQLIKADSHEVAEEIALKMARENWSEEDWGHSVSLTELEWHAKDVELRVVK